MYNPFSLQGKTILVTGASSGIGRTVAIQSSKMGANVILLARNKSRLEETLALMEGDGHLIKDVDLTKEAEVSAFFPSLPKLDGVVHSAGNLKTCPTKYIKQEDLDEVFDTNLYSPINITTSLLENKKLNKGASIIFLTSVAATLVAQGGNAIYGASKAAILSYSRVLALELSPRRIRVNCVSPGMVETDFINKFSLEPEQIEEDKKKYPFGYGKPDDVAYAIIYLLSDTSTWVTGSNFVLDGGLTLQ